MNKRFKGGLRFILVTVGIVILTSFTIDATDTFRGSQSALSIIADRSFAPTCPSDMVKIDNGDEKFCIDTFEVSAGEGCSIKNPSSVADTAININQKACLPESKKDTLPWTNISLHQAQVVCSKAGKYLATANDWYLAALGTPDTTDCNINGSLSTTGEYQNCQSGVGAYDMVGNVWEMVAGEVVNGRYLDSNLPEEGYVETADQSGIARTTTSTPQVIYNEDYFWSEINPNKVYAVMRGGFYGAKEDAGLYSVHTAIDVNFSGPAIGFRCALRL
ncbi:hypothetical protein KC723_03085 [Candidatus Kaiserbacteria bacterium]|nr:hypothetical protein [Candidatus Kaiserbacteria bacterium]